MPSIVAKCVASRCHVLLAKNWSQAMLYATLLIELPTLLICYCCAATGHLVELVFVAELQRRQPSRQYTATLAASPATNLVSISRRIANPVNDTRSVIYRLISRNPRPP